MGDYHVVLTTLLCGEAHMAAGLPGDGVTVLAQELGELLTAPISW